jgi:DNA-binding CsgD family transcriptional regulator
MGDRQQLVQLRETMRGAGVRRTERPGEGAVRPSTGWGALTEAERRVATLISEGHTNRSAAGELHLSPNTIGTHLRSVFTKLGVQSRVQLSNLVRDRAPAG